MLDKIKLASLLLFFITSVFANAQVLNSSTLNEVQNWLERMSRAAHMQNFVGMFVYSNNSDLNAMRIIHLADKTGEFERLISLDGSGREVIRKNNVVTCILPDRKSVVVEKSRPQAQFPPSFPTQISRLVNHYRFELGQQEKIAGQLTQKITVLPKDDFRYGYILWVDIKTGLLLKSHLIDENNNMIEQFMFTKIEYQKHINENLFNIVPPANDYTWYEAGKNENNLLDVSEQQNQHLKLWYFTKLPPGFKVDVKRQHKMPRGNMPLAHLVLSDGLASVSVYIETHSKSDANLEGNSTMGAVNAYGRHLKKYHITAVGEVPQKAVRLICESVNNKNDND